MRAELAHEGQRQPACEKREWACGVRRVACGVWRVACGVRRVACGVRAVAQTERRARAAGRREAQGQGRYSTALLLYYSTALERRTLTPPSHAMVTERSTSPAASSPVSNAPCTHCAASTLHAWLRVG